MQKLQSPQIYEYSICKMLERTIKDSEGSAENRVKFTKYGQLEELIRLIDEELTKKFDGAQDSPSQLVKRQTLLPKEDNEQESDVYQINLKVVSKLILFIRAFKCICIDNPLGQNVLLQAKMGKRLLNVITVLIKYGNMSQEIGVIRNFIGTFLSFSVNFVTRNKVTQLAHFNALCTHSKFLQIIFESDRYIRIFAIFFHNCIVWNIHLLRHAFVNQYGTYLFKRTFQHIILSQKSKYSNDINEWFTFSLVHILRSQFTEDPALKAQDIIMRQMDRQGSPVKLPEPQKEENKDNLLDDDTPEKPDNLSNPRSGNSRVNSPSPTHMLEKGEEGAESDNILSRAGTGIAGDREQKAKEEKPQQKAKKAQVAVRRKNKYRYVMRKIFAPILLQNIFNNMMKDEELEISDSFEVSLENDAHTFRFIRRDIIGGKSDDARTNTIVRISIGSFKTLGTKKSSKTLKSMEVPKHSALRMSGIDKKVSASFQPPLIDDAKQEESSPRKENQEEEQAIVQSVWSEWYPAISPLQAGLFQMISEILKTSLEEAGSAEQAAQFFSEHNLRFFTSLYGIIIRDLAEKSENPQFIKESFVTFLSDKKIEKKSQTEMDMACELKLMLNMVDIFGKLSQFHGMVQGFLIGMKVLSNTVDFMYILRDLSLQLMILKDPEVFKGIQQALSGQSSASSAVSVDKAEVMSNVSSIDKVAPKAPNNQDKLLKKLKQVKLDEAHKKSPLIGFMSKLAKIIANLSYKNTDACDFFLSDTNHLLFLLRQTQTDFNHPTLRQYSLFAIRNLCQESPEVREAINKFSPTNFDQETGDFLKRIGIILKRTN